MACTIITSVGSRAITIFEGSLHQGKIAVVHAVLRSMGMNCIRINVSPNTSAEDLFERHILQSSPDAGFLTGFVDGRLTIAMKESSNDNLDLILPT
jgi:midasin (ATPase involved in ribosome maturation)